MNSIRAVEPAIENASLLVLRNGQWVSSVEEPYMVDIPDDAGHDYPVTALARDAAEIPPHFACAETPAQFREFLVQYHRILGLPLDEETSKHINFVVGHEEQHAEAAKLQGEHIGSYMLSVHRESRYSEKREWEAAYLPFSLKTTKVGCALLFAYPDAPSNHDLRVMQGLGYKSVFEVGQIALQNGLPAPLSVQKGMAIIPRV